MLKQTHPGLPANWYFDADHYRLEIAAIWQQQWLCIGRTSDWAETGSFHTVRIDDQDILVVRSGPDMLKAFFNTCRHRGSVLCEASSGRLKNKRVVCPYHAWTYDLDGRLTHTPRRVETSDFDPTQHGLYPVALECWGGFVFISLAESVDQPLAEFLGTGTAELDNWPLQELQLAHREVHTVACNWKIFWENYLECYHCPGIHPELCKLVPIYGQGFMSPEDFKAVGETAPVSNGRLLRENAETWAAQGHSGLDDFPDLDEAQLQRGMTFIDAVPSMFIVAHRDYVRSVRVMPLGPESTRLTVDWLLPQSSMNADPGTIAKMVSFAQQVVKEDAGACELNQKGLRSLRHRQGVLMPQEYEVLAFDQWVRDRLQV